jgi:hypothetical protein
MQGSDGSRPAARYQGYRALFLLLQSAAYQSIRLSNPDAGYSRSGPPASRKGRWFDKSWPSSPVWQTEGDRGGSIR